MVRWINQPKNIYFLFFGVQNHLIFHWKLPGLGKFQSYDFFGFVGNLASQEPITGQVCDGKTAWKKNIEIVGSFNGITTTCKLMTGIFFHNSETIAVCHVYVTQSSLKRPIHVTRDISSTREFRCGLSQFHCENGVKQGHKVQPIKYQGHPTRI